ncbi:unnamed protein product, partial [Adineta steineri]
IDTITSSSNDKGLYDLGTYVFDEYLFSSIGTMLRDRDREQLKQSFVCIDTAIDNLR